MAIFIIDLVGNDEETVIVTTTSQKAQEEKVVDRASVPMPHLEIVPIERDVFRRKKSSRKITN